MKFRLAHTLLNVALGGVLLAGSAVAAQAPKKAAVPVKAAPPKPAPAKTEPVKTAPVKAVPKPASKPTAKPIAKPQVVVRARRRGAKPRVVVIPRQAQPTKERLAEIQQALVAKGYFNGQPSGEWNNDSTEALKKFQDDQSLKATGKLNSLSLIALGLGPTHNPLGTLPVVTPPVAGPEAPGAEGDEQELVTPASPGLAH